MRVFLACWWWTVTATVCLCNHISKADGHIFHPHVASKLHINPSRFHDGIDGIDDVSVSVSVNGEQRSMMSMPFIRTRTKHALHILRGGSDEKEQTDDETDNDEERYSRQFYTLGARAHSLVRSSTILIDGPLKSGLVYESIKNLALSGVGKIILLTNTGSCTNTDSDDDDDDNDDMNDAELEDIYFDDELDDLGKVYRRGAMKECYHDKNDDEEMKHMDDVELMVEYVRRLNPSVKIDVMERSEFISISSSSPSGETDVSVSPLGSNPVLLCIDRPLSTQIHLNEVCRDANALFKDGGIHIQHIPFVSIETAGVYGKAFCDFGDDFQVLDEDGETPKATLLESIARSGGDDDKNEEELVVIHCVDGERHDVSKGDKIEFQWKNGVGGDGDDDEEDNVMDGRECEIVYVKNPTCFTVKFLPSKSGDAIDGDEELNDIVAKIQENANSFTRKKLPRDVPFLSLKDALASMDDPRKQIFAASDLDKSFDPVRRRAVMSSFASLETYVKENELLPSSSSDDVSDFVCQLSEEDDKINNDECAAIATSFAKCARAKFTPLQAIYGALGAQEALKAASGLYNPIQQFLLYDCDEILAKVKSSDDESTASSGMQYILGKKLTKKLSSRKVFVVGSGAIGCEILKNLAAMDIGTRTKKGGSVILTDMDTIEKSNLSRQLLFRDGDVGKFKSIAAEEAMERLNPRVQMNVHTSKVGDDSKEETYFNDKFWSNGVDIVLNALDNVEARLFIDSQCVANQKALIDAGTLGAKGNVQVVVPRKSESYGSSADPPEPTIPVCTLKNFPYEISHTIQWGRDLFDGLYNRRPSQVNEQKQSLSDMSVTEFARNLLTKVGEDPAMEIANELAEDCLYFDPDEDADSSDVKQSSLKWACSLVTKLYYQAMKDLLKQHPLDSLDDDDEPFWSGSRRAPTPLYYSADSSSSEQDTVNKNLVDFVRCAARLRIEMYQSSEDNFGSSSISEDEATEALLAHTEENGDKCKSDINDQSPQERVKAGLKHAKEICGQLNYDLISVEFEKDDESNGHVSFVTAASNLRAIAYGITPVDEMETRKVAGRIVPAMITTTAFVSALSCIELVKLTQKAPLRQFRNAFVNLALPFFAFTVPLPAEETPGLHGSSHTIWDKMIVKESEKNHAKGGVTLRRFIRQLIKKASKNYGGEGQVSISNISYGPYMLYANFLHDEDDTLLDTPMQQILIDAVSSGDIEDFDDEDFDESDTEEEYTEAQLADIMALKKRAFADLTVVVEDPVTGDEAELPPVRLLWWKN